MTVEPVVGTIRGYRVFEVAGGVLSSIAMDYDWVPGWNTAKCHGSPRRKTSHEAPAPRCKCGFWVYKTVARAMDQFAGDLGVDVDTSGYGDFDGPRGVVLGQVQVAGRVIEGADGWRAGRAGIVTLLADDAEWLAHVAASYGALIEPLPEMDRPVRGVLTDVGDAGVRVLQLEGDHKFTFESLRVEKGSPLHGVAASAAGREVVLEYERRDGDKWVTRIVTERAEGP